MANFCENCGAPLRAGAKFCTECGYKMPADVAPDKPAPAAPPSPAPPSASGEIRRAVPAHRAAEQKKAVRKAKPEVRRQEPVQRLPEPKAASVPKKSTGSTGLAVFLSLVMVAEAAVAGFKYPGWFRKEDSNTGSNPLSGSSILNENSAPIGKTAPKADAAYLKELGLTQEQLDRYFQDPIAVTAENSPGNPALIDVSFTKEELDSAKAVSAPVSWEKPEADFPEFGIHADLKQWNLKNENDELTVRKLPVKTCEATGSTLYTYDYSLASGQKLFPTEAEITLPIQGDSELFEGMVHFNGETGKWEEDYYTLSEDGKSVTVRMTHFSESAQSSVSKKKLQKLKDTAVHASAYYQTDGNSIFWITPFEDQCKYKDVETWLYSVGLVRIPDFEKLLKAEDKYANTVLKSLLNGTGGINAELGLSEAMASMGSGADGGSAAHTLLEQTKSINGESWNTQVFGYSLTAAGWMTLLLRVMDQVYRGVSLGNIAESNRWSTVSSIVSLCGMIAAAAGAAPQAALFGLICAGIFAVTKIKDAAAANYNAKYPLGEATTLEEMVFNYYVSDYNDGTEDAVQNALRRVLAKIPPPGNAQHAIGYDTKTDIRGNGWADALTYILDHYRTDPINMTNAVAAMYQEYETYINRFFDGLNGQSGDSSALRDRCWRQFISSFLSPAAAPELRYDPNKNTQTELRKFAGAHPVLFSEEVSRCQQIAVWAQGQSRSWSEIWSSSDADSELSPPISLARGVTASKVGDLEMFTRFTKDYADSLKKKAMNVLYTNTNKVLSAMYVRYRDDAIKEARDQLYDEVLPFFNTHLTFYILDESLKNTKMSDTPYTKFTFTDMGSFPLFEPANKRVMQTVLDQPLNLKKNRDKPILLVTNVYNYVRWHCPTSVDISDDKDSLKGIADWEKVDFKVDKHIGLAGMDDKIRQTLSPEANTHSVHDVKVPIRYGNKDAPGLEQFLGTWENESGDRQYRATFLAAKEDASEIDFILELKTKEDRNYKTYTQYTLSKKNIGSVYKFNGKTLLLSDDHFSHYATVGDQDFRFRISLQKNTLKLEEWLYTSNELLDNTKELKAFTLYKGKPEDGRYDNLILEQDSPLTWFGRSSDVIVSALHEKQPAGNSVVIAPDGTVTVTLAPAEVTSKANQNGNPVSVTSKRGSYTFTASAKGSLTSLPDYTATWTFTSYAEGEEGSITGSNKLENIDMERSRISVNYTDSRRLERVFIFLFGDIVHQYGEEKTVTSFTGQVPMVIELVP